MNPEIASGGDGSWIWYLDTCPKDGNCARICEGSGYKHFFYFLF